MLRHNNFRLALDYLEEKSNIFLDLETKLHFSCVKSDLFVCVDGENAMLESVYVSTEYGRGPAIMYSKINAHVVAF